MAVQNSEFQRLIAELPLKEQRERKVYLSYTIITVVLGGAWLVYSLFNVTKLRAESQKLRTEVNEQQVLLEKTKDELKAKNEELARIAQEMRIPLEELHNLKNFGFLSSTEGIPDLRTYTEQSSKINTELQSIESRPASKDRRKHLSIRYVVRAQDNGRVEQAMERLGQDHGFTTRPAEQQEPITYTNAIWIVRNSITEEDARLVAYYLMLRGIQIKYIGPPTSTPQKALSSPDAIWLVAEPKVEKEAPLTVEQIKTLNRSTLTHGTKPGIH